MELEILGERVSVDASLLDARPSTIRTQLREYEAGVRTEFDVAVDPPATLTGRVMDAMVSIPYGTVRTYGDLAEDLDTAAVAVGQAAGRNPVPIVVPCHRVVGASGVGGYSAGSGETLKRRLLRLEGIDLSRPESFRTDDLHLD